MYGYIYKTTNLVNNKIYIGQKKAQKFKESYKGSGRYLKNALKKYGEHNFKVEILEWCESIDIINKREKYWILYYEEKGFKMYNIAKGAAGGDTYYKLTEEDRQKRIEKLKKNGYFNFETEEAKKLRIDRTRQTRIQKGNYKWTEEQKKAQSERLKGSIVISEETRKKISLANTGKKLTEEHKKKISDSNKGRKLSKEARQNVSNGLKEFYKTHENPFKNKNHTDETKKKISEKCKGLSKGLIWVHNQEQNMRIKPEELEKYLQLGYYKGRLKFKNKQKRKPLTEEHKKKIGDSVRGEKNGFYGHHVTEENKQKMIQGIKEKMSGTIRVNKEGTYKYIKPELLQEYLNNGYEQSKNSKIKRKKRGNKDGK